MFCNYRSLTSFLVASVSLCLLLDQSVANAAPQQGPANVVDFDITPILNCASDNPISDEIALVCNTFLLQEVIDDLVETETLIDAMLVGFRDDLPAEFLAELSTTFIEFNLVELDGLGGRMSEAGSIADTTFPDVAPFEYVISNLAIVNLDAADIPFLVSTGGLNAVIAQATLRALGFAPAFQATGLIGTESFGALRYRGTDGGGFAIDEFRVESGSPFATFIPLLLGENDSVFLSPFESAFFVKGTSLREVLIPLLNEPCTRAFVSRSLRGMFADLGYLVAGINTPGIIDLDGDNVDDDPLFVRQVLLGDVDGNGSVNLLDIAPFVDAISTGSSPNCAAADLNLDGQLDLLDVAPFVAALSGQ